MSSLGNPTKECRKELVRALSELESMWDSHDGWVSIVENWIDLTSSTAHPIHRTPYRTRLKAQILNEWKSRRCWQWTSLSLQRHNEPDRSSLSHKEWLATAHCRLSESEQYIDMGLSFNGEHGWVHRFIRRHANLSYARCEQSLLENVNSELK